MSINEELQNAEAVLIIEGSGDKRMNVGKSLPQGHLHVEPHNWKMWSSSTFGNAIARGLANIGAGYGCEVADMGKAVSVKMTYCNPGTGKSVAKTYVILFDNPETPDGTLFVSMSKWRTFNNYSQAVSYISSSIKSYVGATTSV